MGTRNGSAPVRWREDTGWEYRCEECTAHNSGERFWPLTDEFWTKHAGMNRCRACWLVYWRRRAARYRSESIEVRRAHDRARYRRNRKVLLIKRRVYYEENREAINAKSRARYHERKAA